MDKKSKITIPILIIAFNRPDVTSKTFEYIKAAKPEKLYIAIDGPRPEKSEDEELVKAVKAILQNVDWPCETHYKYNETNKGAEVTISFAISWVFETEEYAIILEDDIIAPLSFLKFAQQMLIKYKDNEKIRTISGSNFTPINTPNNVDYFFARYGHSGGGHAKWKRSWRKYDLNVDIPEEHLSLRFLRKVSNSKKEAKYLQKRFKNMKRRGPGNNTWDNVGFYLHHINQELAIVPKVNLTSNIGTYGLHAKGKTEHHFRPYDENFSVKKHPEKVECFTEYDIHHFKNYMHKKKPLYKRIINKVKRIIKRS